MEDYQVAAIIAANIKSIMDSRPLPRFQVTEDDALAEAWGWIKAAKGGAAVEDQAHICCGPLGSGRCVECGEPL